MRAGFVSGAAIIATSCAAESQGHERAVRVVERDVVIAAEYKTIQTEGAVWHVELNPELVCHVVLHVCGFSAHIRNGEIPGAWMHYGEVTERTLAMRVGYELWSRHRLCWPAALLSASNVEEVHLHPQSRCSLHLNDGQ